MQAQRTIAAAGLKMDDLVSVTYFNRRDLDETFNSVYRSYFNGRYPAQTFVGATGCATARFEVLGVAVKARMSSCEAGAEEVDGSARVLDLLALAAALGPSVLGL
jgi:hypothetical protein